MPLLSLCPSPCIKAASFSLSFSLTHSLLSFTISSPITLSHSHTLTHSHMATPHDKQLLVNGITALSRHIEELEVEESRLLSIFQVPGASGHDSFNATLMMQDERDLLNAARLKIYYVAVEHSKLNILLRQFDDDLGTMLNQGVWNTMLKRQLQLEIGEIAYVDSGDALQAELLHNLENTRLALNLVTEFLEKDPYEYLLQN